MAVERRRWSVCGRVQGVGFRTFVVHRARELGLKGWVRNCPDGSVEAAAVGEGALLDGLECALRAGPPRATVNRVTRSSGPASLDDATGFAIEY